MGSGGMGNRLSRALRSKNFHTAGVAEVTRITKKQVMHSDEGWSRGDRIALTLQTMPFLESETASA